VDLDAFPDAVVRLDRDRRIVEVNEAASRLVGRTRDELVGSSVAAALAPRLPNGEIVLDGDWPPAARLRSVRRVPEHVLVIATPTGDVAVRATGAYQRAPGGDLVGAVLALRPAARPGHEPSGAEVVATVSHELRSPLTSVKGYTSLLVNRWDRLDDDQKRLMIDQIHADADRVTRLVTELLDISRLETGRLQLRRQLVELPALVEKVAGKLVVTYPELRCSIEFPPDFPRVYADPDKVEQVLTNLVENAAKYAGPEIRVVGDADPDRVSVAVHDRGEGIPPAELPRLFGKFARGRQGGRPSGTGLGLWITRGLVEAHGGTITVTSNVGEGSVFTFTLPRLDPDAVIAGTGWTPSQ
jgi:signal transduction histidine kinase